MSYYNVVLKDNPVGFWKLDETSGTTAYDYSGCGNNGTYSGFSSFENIFPLVSGGTHSTLINNSRSITLSISKDYTGSSALGHIADKYSSDNDFTLEVWAYIKSTDIVIPILVNEDSNTGIYYKNNAIYFYVNDEYVSYQPGNLNESLHIVAIYENSFIKLYINGEFCAVKNLNNFKFNNDSMTSLKIGPTPTSGKTFIVDAPAVYRYALTESEIKMHFNSFKTIPSIQIVQPDGGVLFSGTDVECLKGFEFSYPLTRKWEKVLNNDIFYNSDYDYITLQDESNSTTIYDSFTIPSGISFISSKIEWESENGISVSASIDGIDYVECSNGYALPQWKLGEDTFSSNTTVYLKIDLTTYDSTILKPILKNIKIFFYTQKLIYADNFGDYISLEQPAGSSIDTSVWDLSAPSNIYPILRRNELAGFRPESQAGFAINTNTDISTIEMLVRIPDSYTDGSLFSHPDAWFSWGTNYVISKQGISAIYVNGQNITSATNISSYLVAGEIHHIVIILSSSITDKIYINSKVSSGIWQNSGTGYSYSNIAIYPSQLSNTKVTEHYNLYTQIPYSYGDIVSIDMTESEIKVYDNDWQVVKSV